MTPLLTRRSLAALAVCLVPLAAAAVESPIAVQGSVVTGGAPFTGSRLMSFQLFDAPSGGTLKYSKTATTALENGVYSATLGDSPAFAAGLFSGSPTMYLEVGFDSDNNASVSAGELFAPRQPLLAAPFSNFANTAGDAATVGGFAAAGFLKSTGPQTYTTTLTALTANTVGLDAVTSTAGPQGDFDLTGFTARANGGGATSVSLVRSIRADTLGDAGTVAGLTAQSSYSGANTSTATASLPSVVGVSAAARLAPGNAGKAAQAAGVSASSTVANGGGNLGTVSVARNGSLYNVGVYGASNSTDNQIANNLANLGVNSGVLAYNNANGGANYALYATGDVRFDGGTFTQFSRTVASASALSLGNGNVFTVTGSVNIASISQSGKPAGTEVTLIFTGSPTLSNSGTLFLQGAGNFTASPNTVLKLVTNGTNWYEVSRSVNR